MHARYFFAHLGRFHSIDPVGGTEYDPQSWNRYAYVLGNPMKYTDPRGLIPGIWEPYDQFAGAFLSSMNFITVTASYHYLPGIASVPIRGSDWITTTAKISAGIGDALLLGFGDELRALTDRAFGLTASGLVDRCSDSYRGASVTTTTATAVVGGGRLLYAGTAKGLSVGARIAGTEAAAIRAAQSRDALKVGFRLGLDRSARIVPAGERLAQRRSAEALARAVGRTNPAWNAAGAGAVVGSVNSFFNLPNCGAGS